MGHFSRAIFVAVPFILTWGTLIGLLLVFTGETGKNAVSQSFYFLRVNTPGVDELDDFYKIGPWNYCSGSSTDSEAYPSTCSNSTTAYFFNVTAVFNIDPTFTFDFDTEYAETFSTTFTTLSRLTTFTFWAFFIALITTALTLPISLFAFQRRLGSLLALITSTISMLFCVAATASTTALYTLLRTYINANPSLSGFTASIGTPALAAAWFASAASVASFFFWAFTACCCKGRVAARDAPSRGGAGDEYERIYTPAFPARGPMGFQPAMSNVRSGYEGVGAYERDDERYFGAEGVRGVPAYEPSPVGEEEDEGRDEVGEMKGLWGGEGVQRGPSVAASSVYSRYEPVRA